MKTVTAKTPAIDWIRALGAKSPKRRQSKATVTAAEGLDKAQQVPEETFEEAGVAPAASAEGTETAAVVLTADVRRSTKTDQVVQQLQTEGGSSIAEIMEKTGWQAHSVRGFFSAVVRKKLGLDLVSTVGEDGTRRYRINTKVAA